MSQSSNSRTRKPGQRFVDTVNNSKRPWSPPVHGGKHAPTPTPTPTPAGPVAADPGVSEIDFFNIQKNPLGCIPANPILGSPGDTWPVSTPPVSPMFPSVQLPTPRQHVPGQPLRVEVVGESLHIGNVAIRFMRTLRIPDDGKHYPLPPGLGVFPLRRVADYADRVPESWREHGGVFLPIYQREAMWLSFSAAHWRPNAIKVAVGKVNALSGRPWSEKLEAGGRVRGEGAQDYMVVPDQPWLDGINAGGGSTIKQFVAMPLGMGYTVEGQVTGEETHGGLQLCVFEPKSGCFPDTAPAPARYRRSGGVTQDFGDFGGSIMKAQGVSTLYASTLRSAPTMAFNALAAESFVGQEMGLAAGGRMKQSIYPDRHGIECWDESNHARVFIHLVNSHMWQKITGEAIPATPVDARTYANHGYPWFDLYDEHLGDINAAAELDGVKSVKEMDEGKGFKPQQDDGGIDVADAVVQKLPLTLSDISPYGVGDGEW